MYLYLVAWPAFTGRAKGELMDIELTRLLVQRHELINQWLRLKKELMALEDGIKANAQEIIKRGSDYVKLPLEEFIARLDQ